MNSSYQHLSQEHEQHTEKEPSYIQTHGSEPLSSPLNENETNYQTTSGDTSGTPSQTSTALSSSYPSLTKKHGIEGAVWEILLSGFIVVLTMTALSAALIAIVYTNRINITSPFDDFDMAGFVHNEPNVIWVNYSATKIATVASWASTAAPMMASFVMALLSFPLARNFLKSSRTNRSRRLPTPYQLSLLVGIIGSKTGSLLDWFMYKFWKRSGDKKGIQSQPQKQAGILTWALGGFVFVLSIGYAIVALDTWFHVTITTVPFTSFTYTRQPTSQYGRGISPNCLEWFGIQVNDISMPSCEVAESSTGVFENNSTESLSTLFDSSGLNTVEMGVVNQTTSSNGTSFAFLRPTVLTPDVDYRASTIAVAAQCKPMSRRCHLKLYDGASTPFNCTPALYGDLTQGTWLGWESTNTMSFQMRFFKDAAMTNNDTKYNNLTDRMNPFYIGTGGMFSFSTNAISDPEVVHPSHGGMGFLLNCSVTVYDLQYDYINSTFGGWNFSLGNTSLATFVERPIYQGEPMFAGPYLEMGLLVASFQDTAQGIADYFGTILSKAALSLTAGSVTPRSTLVEQNRTTLLTTRVEKTPLYCLIALDFLYILLGLVAVTYALLTRGDEVDDVRARLSIRAMIAYALEGKHAEEQVASTQELFAERQGGTGRVEIVQTEQGGWKFAPLGHQE